MFFERLVVKIISACLLFCFCAQRRSFDRKEPSIQNRLQTPVSVKPIEDQYADPYIWLESESKETEAFVQKQNAKAIADLKNDDRFHKIFRQIKAIDTANDRIPSITHQDGYVYRFWQSSKNERGVWQSASLAEFKKNPMLPWQNILDLDALADEEKENWVWDGADCLQKTTRCIVTLSRGGKDAIVVREFDTEQKKFIADGFVLEEGKHHLKWVNVDTVLVVAALGVTSLTEAGYPRQVRLWKRGQKINSAPIVFEGQQTDASVSVWTSISETATHRFISQNVGRFLRKNWLMLADNSISQLPIPENADVLNLYQNKIVFLLRSPWRLKDRTFAAGSLMALDILPKFSEPYLIYTPRQSSTVESVAVTKNYLVAHISENVSSKILTFHYHNNKWSKGSLVVPKMGGVSFSSVDTDDDDLFFEFESYLLPKTLYHVRVKPGDNIQPRDIMKGKQKFESSNFNLKQWFATSADGTRIPYFIIYPKGIDFDGNNPTLLYGYGGFGASLLPIYLQHTGQIWLSKKGVYVVANIRGGNEFGPSWHEAAIKENRQKAFDDFIAVAQDLQDRKVTSKRRLGIIGASNGGLLTGAVFVQRPELFNAVVSESPLLDMLRYNKLSAGASWVGEYGDPDDASSPVGAAIRKYSPYQNLSPQQHYPKVFFVTNKADDRVHPGHARKMAARMEAQGHGVLFYQHADGGHGSATLDAQATVDAMVWNFLMQQLMD